MIDAKLRDSKTLEGSFQTQSTDGNQKDKHWLSGISFTKHTQLIY